MFRRFIIAAWAVGHMALSAPAQPGDLLDQTKRLREVAAQKFDADLRLGLQEVGRIIDDQPQKAVEQLNALLARLDGETAIDDARKATLRRVLNDRIRVARLGVDSRADREATKAALEAAAKARREQLERSAKERAAVRAGLKQVEQLNKDGDQTGAAKKLAELIQEYPTDTAVQFLTGALQNAVNLKADAEIRQEKEQAYVAVMRDVDRASVPAVNDIEFPKDWKERTKLRTAAAGLTEEEKKILRVLSGPIPVQFRGTKLQEALDYISTVTGQTIILDQTALDEAAVTYDSPVTFVARDPVSTRLVLRTILSNLNLTYVVRNNVIFVTNRDKAKDMMVTRVYYLGDLVTGLGAMGGAAGVGIGLDQIQAAQNVSAIVEMVTSSIDPESWEKRGGLGVIGFNQATMSLIVRQSQEVHALIRQSLFR